MAQTVAVVRNTLSATLSGTADFTSSGFGTPTAAIIIWCNANATNNPQADAITGVGFWDGTNQRVVSFACTDNSANSATARSSDDSYGAKQTAGSGSSEVSYTVSAITDGIRLTLSVDNTGVGRFCTVLLIAGVSAVTGTFTPNATQDATQESASLGIAPDLIFFASIGDTVADRTGATTAVISFGFAEQGAVHRAIMWSSADSAANETAVVQFSETRCVGDVMGGSLVWSGEVTTFGADTFTMTTRDGATGSNVLFFLALGGADLSYDCGTLTTPVATGNDVNATDIAPDALLLMLSGASSTTLATDSQANSLMLGMADDNGEFCHNIIVEDAAATMNTASQASATACVDLDSSSGAAKTDLCDATATLNASDFTLNYTVVDGTARKGWWVAFGNAAPAAGNRRRRSIICGSR